MFAFCNEHKQHLGLVSIDIPLISNLEVWLNIALIIQYHQNISNSVARSYVLQYLERFNIKGIADKRNPALTHKERFYTMLLRAVMVVDSIVVIDRPFQLLPYLPNADFIIDALRIVADSHVESHVFDYSSNGYRYRTDNAEKN